MMGELLDPLTMGEPSSIQWRDDVFLGQSPLNQGTVMDYFARSPFYSVNCNNEECKRLGLGLNMLQCASTPCLHIPECLRGAGAGQRPQPSPAGPLPARARSRPPR